MNSRAKFPLVDPELVRVTDHAVVRWLERVEGYPVEELRRALVTPTVLLGMAMGARRVHRPGDGVTLRLVGTAIVTVLPLSRGEPGSSAGPAQEPRP